MFSTNIDTHTTYLFMTQLFCNYRWQGIKTYCSIFFWNLILSCQLIADQCISPSAPQEKLVCLHPFCTLSFYIYSYQCTAHQPHENKFCSLPFWFDVYSYLLILFVSMCSPSASWELFFFTFILVFQLLSLFMSICR